ncbi:MAG: immunoglobulin-like domain-containing protein [Roseburia sp.]
MNEEQRRRKSREQARKRKIKRMRRQRRILIFCMTAILAGAVYGIYRGFFDRVYKKCVVEVGTSVSVSDFMKSERYEGVYTEASPTVDTDTPGIYNVFIKSGPFTYHSELTVQDTKAPQGTVQELSVSKGNTVSASEFVTAVEDATQVTVSYAKVPDFNTVGDQEVTVRLEDAGGNVTDLSTVLHVEPEDTEPPVISGVEDLTVEVGKSISYKREITVTDNCDDNVELVVDSSGVNLNEIGTYTVSYSATDRAGNTVTATAQVFVVEASAQTATAEEVNAVADQVLSEILTDDMTQLDQAYAIYRYVHDNISYIDSSPKDNWVEGAYLGLVEHKGDCYVYAMTAKCLLTRAGITNMDIEKIPSDTRHYWNLIDVGEGWHHFDATRRKDGTEFFYWTDAELMEYSNANSGSHNYDPEQYPEIQ